MYSCREIHWGATFFSCSCSAEQCGHASPHSAVHRASGSGTLQLQPKVVASKASPWGVLRSSSSMPLLFPHKPWTSVLLGRVIMAIWDWPNLSWMPRLVSTTTNMPAWWIFTSPNCRVTGRNLFSPFTCRAQIYFICIYKNRLALCCKKKKKKVKSDSEARMVMWPLAPPNLSLPKCSLFPLCRY